MRVKVLLGVTDRRDLLDGQPTHPAFSGTNGKIAFARYPRTSAPYEEIYTVNPDGSGVTRLTGRLGVKQSSVMPAFSPDGTKIAYMRGSSSAQEIVIMDASGTELDSFAAPPDTGYSGPAWSPDSI